LYRDFTECPDLADFLHGFAKMSFSLFCGGVSVLVSTGLGAANSPPVEFIEDKERLMCECFRNLRLRLLACLSFSHTIPPEWLYREGHGTDGRSSTLHYQFLQPVNPFRETLACLAGDFKYLQLRVKRKRVPPDLLNVNIRYGARSILLRRSADDSWNIRGYLRGLSCPSAILRTMTLMSSPTLNSAGIQDYRHSR